MFRSVVVNVGTALLLLPGGVLTLGAVTSAAASVDSYPPGTTLHPARLERGAETPLLHTEGKVIVDGPTRIRVRGVANLWLLGRIGRGYLLETADTDFQRFAVQLVRWDGSRRILQRFGQRTSPAVSADGRRIALVTLDRPKTRIRVVKTRSGALVRERTFPSYGVEVSDYGVRRMVITGVRSRTFWWDPVSGRRTLIVARPARADISANRLVVRVPHPTVSHRVCQKTVALRRPSVVLWRSCKDTPIEFAPDGRRMVTVSIDSDGIGPGVVQVRRQRGKVLRTFRAPTYFGFVEWESNRRLLLQPVGRRYVAAVRCTLPGGCERASRLYEAPALFDPIETMRWSFP